MTTKPRRMARRLLEVFDWRTFAVAGAFLTALLIGYAFYSAFQAAHDATDAANQRGRAASRRIDLLNAQIQQLQQAIAAGQDERGQLAASVAALTAQIRQLGGQPVITAAPVTIIIRPSASPAPRPSRTATPRPSPTATRTGSPSPSPRPTASPTRTPCVLIILC